MAAHSNVMVNLKAVEALALGRLLEAVEDEYGPPSDADEAAAVEKVKQAATRAAIPWSERT